MYVLYMFEVLLKIQQPDIRGFSLRTFLKGEVHSKIVTFFLFANGKMMQ